ncbi:MAG TPA: hypothetical protein VFW12_06565 [Candidatus Limnocylindria bacterium]|nr:hypothetical protein [Candidatus Limnocylindria bacterium]
MTTRRSSLRPLAACLAIALTLACTTPEPRVRLQDATEGPRLATAAAAVLLQLSAYDYALVGSLTGQRDRVVSTERYSTVARDAVREINSIASETVAVTADTEGPIRERLVALADRLTLLGRDVTAYADGGDAAALARVVEGVSAGWERLRELSVAIPGDADLQRTLTRGTSFVVTARTVRVFALTVGPYATQADADAAARRIGQVESVTRASPFVVRVGTYPDRAAADAAAAALVPKGFATSSVSEEQQHAFARSGRAPDVELWREPARFFDTAGGARRVAVSPDGAWLATGSDDGTVAIFSGDGQLRALPKFNAGIAHLVFSDDSAWLFAGGVTLANLRVPSGAAFGTTLRLPNAATQAVFVPAARAFAASSRGPTGLPGGGGGLVAGRAPDGATLGAPFPLITPAAGSVLAASVAGELYIATPASGGAGTDIEVFRVGAERFPRGIVRLPGTVRSLAIDPTGTRAAALTDQGVVRFGPRDGDPAKTVSTVAPAAAREIAFGADSALYVLEPTRLLALEPTGQPRWTAALTDGRRLVAAKRIIVLDGTERLLALDAAGRPEELGTGGTIQDISASADGVRVAALVDARRAVLFTLP